MAPTSTAPASLGTLTGSADHAQATLASDFDGDEFSNNLFNDLAPLLMLFGEQVTKQFLSMSLGWAGNILLAVGPLGIITTIISAIRVGNVKVLKALIGRQVLPSTISYIHLLMVTFSAREKLATAELELLSSTSAETSELWNDGGVVRQPSHALFLELIAYRKENEEEQPAISWDVLMEESNAEGEIRIGDLGTLHGNDVIEERRPTVPRLLSSLLEMLDFGLRPPPIKP